MASYDKKEKEFYKRLKNFPHTFQLQNQDRPYRHKLTDVERSLKNSLAHSLNTPEEKTRAKNLLAFVIFHVRPAEAIKDAEWSIDKGGQNMNIVTLANCAVMLWRQEYPVKAERLVKKLEEIEKENPDFPGLVVKAKGELAFTYSCLDPSFYPLAEQLFVEVIEDAPDPEVWLWKFGLALTRRRLLRLQMTQTVPEEKEFLSVLDLYMDIVSHCQLKRWKARSYAEVAYLMCMPSSTVVIEALKKEAGFNIEEACQKAISFDKKDNSVLWKCGTVLRRLGKIHESFELLDTAVKRQCTSKGLHHLGLTHLAMTRKNKKKKSPSGHCSYHHAQKRMETVFSQESAGATIPACEAAVQPEMQDCSDKKLIQTIPSPEIVDQSQEQSEASLVVSNFNKCIHGVERQFSEEDENIRQALECFRRAVEVSDWQNSSAVIDFALTCSKMGKYRDAKENLEKAIEKDCHLNPFDAMQMFELLGLVTAKLADKTRYPKQRKRYEEESQSSFLKALQTASEYYAESVEFKNDIEFMWRSFSALVDAVERNECSHVDKLTKKAKFLSLIWRIKDSLEILKHIKMLDPQHAERPECVKLFIDNCVKEKRYEDALVCVELLQYTSQKKVLEMFENNFPSQLNMKAARQALMRRTAGYRHRFRKVFHKQRLAEALPASEWDVHILYDRDQRRDFERAGLLEKALDKFYGLKVTSNGQNAGLGCMISCLDSVMQKSRMVLVLAGHTQMSKLFEYITTMAARQPFKATLLVSGDVIPAPMKDYPSRHLPDDHFNFECEDQLSDQQVSRICDLFSFLVDLVYS